MGATGTQGGSVARRLLGDGWHIRVFTRSREKAGDTFRIPELEKKYGKPIIFKAVDTGGAFTNKGFGRVDICTGSRRDSVDSTVNGNLTLMKMT